MAHTLLPDPSALCLDHIAVEEGVIVFHVATTARAAPCPVCGCHSARIHSRYRRTLQDLPWQGNTVRFLLTVPKFFGLLVLLRQQGLPQENLRPADRWGCPALPAQDDMPR